MDVTSTQGIAATTTAVAAPTPAPSTAGLTGAAIAAPSTNPGKVAAAATTASSSSAATTGISPVLGSSSTQAKAATAASRAGIAPAIAKLFGTGGGAPTPIPLNVSYKVDGDFIVTVFSDPKTGQEITQLPPEILIGLAQFFDQQDGVTLDHNA